MDTGALGKLDGLSSFARRVLAARRAPEPPVRSELFGLARFQEHGRSLAQAQVVEPDDARRRGPSFFPRVDENLVALRQAFDYVAVTSRSGHYVTPAAEWLLDNFHLVEAQLQQIREGVPRRYYADLPKLAAPPLTGLPRVYGIAWAYVAHTDSVLNPETFVAFLNAYQEVDELRLAELWALPTTLRVVLLENLRRVADRIAFSKVAREVAHRVCDNAGKLDERDLDELLALLRQCDLQRNFLTQLWQRMPQEQLDGSLPLVRWTERHCADGAALLAESQTAQVETNVTVSNIITALRLIGQVDWPDLIEPASHSLRIFAQLPSYRRESERTRQQITQAMERLAHRAKRAESHVARIVLELARGGESTVERTAGHWLVGAGRPALERKLGMPAPGVLAAVRHRDWRLPAYLGAIALGTALLLLVAARHAQGPAWATALALVLAAFPASEAAVSFIHRLIAESVKVHALPRLDFALGIPEEHRALVAVPSMLTSPAAIAALVERLELHWLANRETACQFALLTDWADADQQSAPGDASLLEEALRQLAALNARYPSSDGWPRFLLLHRGREWSATQQRWLGWERKRGKLEMLLRRLATGESGGFLPLHGQELAPGIRYLVTLDADTGLAPGALRELVSVAAHPLNAPVVDRGRRVVTAGYGILQPRVLTPLPQAQEHSPYHFLFAGQTGIDPYSAGVSDVYQDVFGSGSFIGKGLLHVEAVHAVLDRRLPAEAVLSHDLLEGTVARCGYVSDVALLEDHPHHAGVAASRVHRWTRGDWQLLPLMGRARTFGIDALGLWKMADNLRRSLVAPASIALIAWTLFTQALPLAVAVLLALLALLAGPLLGGLSGLVPTRRNIAWRHFYDTGFVSLWRAVGTALFQFTQLAAQFGLLLDAIGRTLARLRTRRRLLEWTTAAQAQESALYSLGAFVRAHAVASAACVLLAGVAIAASPHPVAGAALFFLWASAPLVAWRASRPIVRRPADALAPEERAYLRALAADIWRFFEHCVTAEDHHLPPDNLQLAPQPTIAHRTSPTNIGLYLLAVACAREFGWITTAQAIERWQATLASVERLPLHHGHLLNWYDTRTLEVLQPPYVSTVDSGNFAALLIAVAQACRALAARSDEAEQAALQDIASRCVALQSAMDFRPLYDAKRHLFHIGLRVREQALDASYYDLLASEARLASFLAMAQGMAPLRHWRALGRPFLTVAAMAGLKSWSGSMFEYLMPTLLMNEPPGGLLHSAALAAIAEQQAHGERQGLPWGVSESAYFAQDHTLAYQYSPYGVPRLALRRTPPTDRVVAPYATAMAAMFRPRDAIANLRRLQAIGARGEFGFFEALDFTVARQAIPGEARVVDAYMAHHQGMSLAALCNLLCGDAPRRWFGSHPLALAHDAVLHESAPRQVVRAADPRVPPPAPQDQRGPVVMGRDLSPLAPGWKPTHLLSNGRYSVGLRPGGAGWSSWRGRSVNRWRDDLLREGCGTFFYLRREDGAQPVSLTASPAPGQRWQYGARFMADRVQFDASGDDVHTSISVLVSPEDDTELRTVTIRNAGRNVLACELVSYFEVVLADPRADEAHPAFSNLFVQTRWHARWNALVMSRRPRLPTDAAAACAHFLAEAQADVQGIECTADRRAFLGRNRDVGHPLLWRQHHLEDGTPVNGLDPVASLRVKLRIAPGATAKLTFATAAGDGEDELVARIDKYLQPVHVERATLMAATLAQVRLRDLSIDPEELLAIQDLTTALAYSVPRPGAQRQAVDRRQIWRFGISGDRPIVLVRIHSAVGLPLVHSLIEAQPWWRFGGLAVDIVVLNGEPASYLMPLQRDVLAHRDRLAHATLDSFGRLDSGFFMLREEEVSASERAALGAMARVLLIADGRPLDLQAGILRDAWTQRPAPADFTRLDAPAPGDTPLAIPSGRFYRESGEFQFELEGQHRPLRPWCNVIANPSFGFQVSEAGSGYTWATNSRLNQVTAWSNDPVTDPPSEHWLVQDLDSRDLMPLVPRGSPQRWRVHHGAGYTTFQGAYGELACETTFLADLEAPVKLVRVRLRNEGGARRRLRALGIAEWILGPARSSRRTVQTWKCADAPAVLAQQCEGREEAIGTSFLALAGTGATGAPAWTCERAEFFDAAGRFGVPDALGRRSGSACDPCGALAHDFTLAPGAKAEFTFVLGYAAHPPAAEEMAVRWSTCDAGAVLAAVKAYWSGLLGAVQVGTPDPLFDALVNRWLLYQTVSCRMWSKAAFYQAGGAFGYRDQLQDAMALALADPARLRQQIVVNASRQFPEGDVQHWWHAPGGEGVRTHFSDDLAWLPYACAHYLDVTGDATILDETVPFLDGPPIPEGAEDAYYAPQVSAQSATVYEHAARTIDRSLRSGAHGLPLMGTGDWNDGMNRVGHEGRGESVWLAWFLCVVVERFAPVAIRRGEADRAQCWTAARQGWIAALHADGWDGEWFRRAFFDDGSPLGSRDNAECRIDLIAQAWAVLSGASSEAFTKPAMHALDRELIDRDAGILRLLWPPLAASQPSPGYIQAYPRGVRENGGQYSHGAVWALMAQAESGDFDAAWRSFEMLSPPHRSQHPQRGRAYELEPYVMPGDIYGAAPYAGRGGWSWYTGSAAWLYRAGIETILGLEVRPDALRLVPRVPSHWPGFQLRLRIRQRDVTLRWSRTAPTDAGARSGYKAAPGEWIAFDTLAEPAVVEIAGFAPVPAAGVSPPAVPQSA